MKYTEIAAFGGLALGIINLLLVLYKDYWRKGKPKVEVLQADVKYIEEGLYYFQINVVISAKATDIQLRKIEIENKHEVLAQDFLNASKAENLKYACPLTEQNLLKGKTKEKIKELVEELYVHKVVIQDYSIIKDKHTSFTFAGPLLTIRYSDCFQELPLMSWYLNVNYQNKLLKIPFDFQAVDEKMGQFVRWN